MKKIIIVAAILSLFTSGAFAKGSSGNYDIAGKARDSNNNILVNKLIIVDFKGKRKEIRTDSFGNYKITIPWIVACRSKLSESEWLKENERLNPKWITVSYDGAEYMIENQWEKYIKTGAASETELTRVLDLQF